MVILFLLSMAVQIAVGQSQPSFDIQGHRGARGLLPENAMAEFLRAVDLGVTTLEIDVVIAGDSTVVASHEPWMSATICRDTEGRAIIRGKDHNIFEMDYETVARYDCGSRGHPGLRGDRMGSRRASSSCCVRADTSTVRSWHGIVG